MSLNDVNHIDPSTVRPLLSVLSTSGVEEVVDMTFVHTYDVGGVGVEVPLKPGGDFIKVTDANKVEYVRLKANEMLVGARKVQLAAIRSGLWSLLPRDHFDRHGFSCHELRSAVCGQATVDTKELRHVCRYDDIRRSRAVVEWFWEIAEQLDDTHRRALLQFWTGLRAVPIGGFPAESRPRIGVVARLRSSGDTASGLPTASTCGPLLMSLPEYESKAELQDKLMQALATINVGGGYMGRA